MLEELAKKDSYWRKVAYNICKNKMIADDLVQEMYLKFVKYGSSNYNNAYICLIILNLWRDYIKIENKNNKFDFSFLENVEEKDFHHEKELEKYISLLSDFPEPFEFEHKTKEDKHKEKIVKDLKWWEKDLITMTHDKSFHEIQRETNLNYQFVRRTLIKAKENGKQKND